MDILMAAVLGIVQGLLEFLPVSSTGHLVLLERLTGASLPALPLHIFLHLGTTAAVTAAFLDDYKRIASELISDLRSSFGRTKPDDGGLTLDGIKDIRPRVRGLGGIMVTATAVTALIGFILRPVAVAATSSLLYTGIGFLATGMILMISEMVKPGITPLREMRPKEGFLIGLFQGITVLPGFSRAAFTISAGIFSGAGKRQAIKLSYMLSAPCVIAAFVFELIRDAAVASYDGRTWLCFIVGAVCAAVTGMLVIKVFMKQLMRRKTGSFACYCFLAGALSVLLNFVI